MLNSPPWHHTANMKLLLFKFVVCFAAALAAPADKQKRDILPGDPRYGTEHNHHEHHQEHENEVQISKAAGGYVGSYTVPDETVPADRSFQVQPQSSYGPPSHTPGQPLGSDFFAPSDADRTIASVLVPSTSYGIPDTTQILNGNYFGPIIDDKKSAVIKTTIEEQPKFDTVHVQKTVIPEAHHEVHHVQQPAVVHKHVGTIPQTASLPQVKVTASHLPTGAQGASVHHSVPSFVSSFPNYSYSSYSNIPVKTVDHHVQVQVPHPYQVPVTKHVAVPVPVPHTVEIPKPYYVRVPQPVQVTVNRPYPVEVPRPVPYPVHHYVKTSVPVAHHVVPTVVDTSKASPFETFQSNFQNVISGLPTFSTPLDNFPNLFENFDISSIPGISFIPGPIQSLIPQGTVPVNTPEQVPSAPISDSVTVDNPALKTETLISKIPVVQPTHHIKTTQGFKGPSTACAGCTVTSSSSNKQDQYVQPTDANGGYVY